MPSTNVYRIIVASIEDDLNSEDKEDVCFDAELFSDDVHDVN